MERIVPDAGDAINNAAFSHRVTDFSKTMDAIIASCRSTGNFYPLMKKISQTSEWESFLESTLVQTIQETRTHIIPDPAMHNMPEYATSMFRFFYWYQGVYNDPAINTDPMLSDYLAASNGIVDINERALFNIVCINRFHYVYPLRNLIANQLLDLTKDNRFSPQERYEMLNDTFEKTTDDLTLNLEDLSKIELEDAKRVLQRTIDGLLKMSAYELTKPKNLADTLSNAHCFASHFLGGYKSTRLRFKSWFIKKTANKHLPHIFHHD